MDATSPDDLVGGALYYRLFDEAERARWRMEDVPFEAIDRARVTPDLVALVREVALSELTTFSASRKFLAEFADDPDFTQWISVWFYEETRHPHVLLRYLHAVGERTDPRVVMRARAAAPFMKSRTGTLVTNIVSEMFASAGYVGLARTAPEPVLALVARNLAADEARHAAAFYAYARRAIAASPTPDDERATALKVLYLWLRESVGHPVRQLRERQDAQGAAFDGGDGGDLEARVCRMIGALVGLPIACAEDILPHVKALAAR